MINYKTKAEGMTYMVGDMPYTINHAIVKVLDYKENEDKIKLFIMFPDGKKVICEPYLDDNVEIDKEMFIRVAYIDLDRGQADDIRIHGYENLLDEEVKEIDKSKYASLEAITSPFGVKSLDPAYLYDKAQKMSRMVPDESLKKLLVFLLQKYKEGYLKYPAANAVHHNYSGGLIQHSVNVAEIAYLIGSRFSNIDLGLVVVAALIHDIGKIYEYNEDGTVSDIGKFRDHITIGAEIISKACDELGVQENIKQHLIHIILSHHGKEEWGSPRKPATEEAFIVHIADYIDSQLYIYHDSLKNIGYGNTLFNKYLGRNVVQTTFMSSDSYLN